MSTKRKKQDIPDGRNYYAYSLEHSYKNSRHRGGAILPPRWRLSFTAVTLSHHRGESNISKARSGEKPL